MCGGEIGRIATGMVADLVVLDGDPLADISNTRRVWRVIQNGHIVDRARLRILARRGA